LKKETVSDDRTVNVLFIYIQTVM